MRHKFKESRIDLGPVGITIVSGATAGIAGKFELYIETNLENGDYISFSSTSMNLLMRSIYTVSNKVTSKFLS